MRQMRNRGVGGWRSSSDWGWETDEQVELGSRRKFWGRPEVRWRRTGITTSLNQFLVSSAAVSSTEPIYLTQYIQNIWSITYDYQQLHNYVRNANNFDISRTNLAISINVPSHANNMLLFLPSIHHSTKPSVMLITIKCSLQYFDQFPLYSCTQILTKHQIWIHSKVIFSKLFYCNTSASD